MSIEEMCKTLRLPYIRDNYKQAIGEASMEDMDFETFLEALLQEEVHMRKENGIRRRIKRARFPYNLLLNDYETKHLNPEIRKKIKQLSTLEFIDNGENIILIGNPGTGKTALSIALGMKACIEGKTVLFINIADFLIQIKEALSNNEVSIYKRKFEKYDLIILDEFGYCSFDKARGELLFNILSSRNEKGSMIITSNLTFDRWDEIFRDQIITGAIVDRLAYKSHLIEMSGESFRIIATKKWNEKNGTSVPS